MIHMMNEHPVERKEKPRVTFALVHGTFARGADWVVNDENPRVFRGKICSELKNDFEINFDIVNWGFKRWPRKLWDNTISRRLHGKQKLEEYLLQCDNVSDTNQRYIVTHSHGGNVSLYALRNTDTHCKITGLICLSSPFLFYPLKQFKRDLLGFSMVLLPILAYSHASVALWTYAGVYTAIVVVMFSARNFGHDEKSKQRILEQKERLRLLVTRFSSLFVLIVMRLLFCSNSHGSSVQLFAGCGD